MPSAPSATLPASEVTYEKIAELERDLTVSWGSKDYPATMRKLPKVMAAWQAYTDRTGHSEEGTAGLMEYRIMEEIATKGDQQWGKIIDDPNIPYEWKMMLMMEILEFRMGKGTVRRDAKGNYVIDAE